MNLENQFPSVTLDSITDDDITISNQFEQEQEREEENFNEPDVEKSTEEEEKVDNQGEEETPETEPDLDNLTQAQALVELFGSAGLQIYNEIPEGLTMEQFVQDIPEYIQTIEQEIRADEQAKLERFADYYQMMMQGVEPETIKPAMLLENIVNLDLDSDEIDSDDLLTVVKTKHLIRGLSEEEAEALANLSAKDINKLKEESIASQEFVKSYIDNIKQEAIQQKQFEIQQEQQRVRYEQEQFVEALNASKEYTKEQKQKFFDMKYKKTEQINYTDDQGNPRREFVTKYDLLLYQMQTEPDKLLQLLELMDSGFNLKNSVRNDVENSYTRKLLDKLEGRTNSNNKLKTNPDEVRSDPAYKPLVF